MAVSLSLHSPIFELNHLYSACFVGPCKQSAPARTTRLTLHSAISACVLISHVLRGQHSAGESAPLPQVTLARPVQLSKYRTSANFICPDELIILFPSCGAD